ncbi:putative ribonuclease H-like domain-containing protein, partial [Tanacetum coccineum]
NQLNKKVKAIRCDNGTEFKNAKLIELCGEKGIKRDYSNARTPQQNGVAERKNRTLIEAARTMLADSKLPTMFWTEATPSISHFKPFGCHVIPPGSIPVPTGSIPVPSGDTMVSPSEVSVPTSGVPVPSGSLTDLFFDVEPTTRFSSPSDLGNNVPSPGIFSSTSYDDEFGADLNNLASTVEDQQRNNHADFQHCLFACFISQVEPRSVAQALDDPSWVDAMKAKMQQFKFQNIWILIDFPEGHRQEEGIDYDEVFALVARIEAIRFFLAFASYMGFRVYQIDVKSVFLYRSINEEGEFEMSAMRELIFFLGLQVLQRPDGIFIGQDRYVQEILKKFDLESIRTATTPYEATKPKSKNEHDNPINVHLYRSMIGSLMYLTALRPDIMFAVSACSRNQVLPTTSNLEAMKKIFKYLKGQPKLGL